MNAAVQTAPRGREFAFGPDDHAAIARLAYEEAGILLPPAKAQLVYGRLARRVRACGLPGFAAYIELLERDEEERVRAVDALTTNHTSFFREGHHFDHFLAETWPALSARLAAGGAVRLWSAACSSGEEPFSLAMAICGRDRQAASALRRRDLRILATDLSTNILAAARDGRFAPDTVRTVPADLRAAWVQSVGDEAEVRPELRALVAFRHLNLLGDWPMRGRFDAIFCRNVMIYFDEPTKARLQARLAERLAPGGYLYIGHSERLAAEVAPGFRCVGRTIFRKVAA
jgi:chemotaxis protein methyltransferase CheR